MRPVPREPDADASFRGVADRIRASVSEHLGGRVLDFRVKVHCNRTRYEARASR